MKEYSFMYGGKKGRKIIKFGDAKNAFYGPLHVTRWLRPALVIHLTAKRPSIVTTTSGVDVDEGEDEEDCDERAHSRLD